MRKPGAPREIQPDPRPAGFERHAVALGAGDNDHDARALHVRQQTFRTQAGKAAADTAEDRVGAITKVQVEHCGLSLCLLQRRQPVRDTDGFIVRRFQFHAHQGLVAQSRQRHRQRVALDIPPATDKHPAALGARQIAQQLAETPAARLHALRANLFEVFHLHGLITEAGSINLAAACEHRLATTDPGCRTLSVMNTTTACKSIVHALCCAAIANWITGCGSTGQKPAMVASSSNPKQIVKSDIDRVLEAHHREMFVSLERLADKLYRRNPREWRRAGLESRDAAMDRLFRAEHQWRLAEFEHRRGVEVMRLAFANDFSGDRVAALIAGMGGMIQTAWSDRTELFLLDELDPQALSNCARNLEISAWKLAQSRDETGELLLLSNEISADGSRNLSFEREMGKMIGWLDMSSQIVAEKNNRVVTRVLQSLATAVFIPVR